MSWDVTQANEPDVWYVTSDDRSRIFAARGRENADWLAGVLDDATNSVVRLYCETVGCGGCGGFITRAAGDARKTVYACDECGKPMVRKAPPAIGIVSEKQSANPLIPDLVTQASQVMHPARVTMNPTPPLPRQVPQVLPNTPLHDARTRVMQLERELADIKLARHTIPAPGVDGAEGSET